jgi:hypothetical protein
MPALLKTTQIQEPSSATVNITLDTAGGLAIGSTGTSSRVVGDFTNATVTTRAAFQTSTANSSTGIYALPSGTSTAASWQATNNSDPTNASKILIATNASTDVQLVSGINGTGTYLPLTFYNGGSERARIDTSGYMQGTVNGLSAGRIPAMQYFRLNSDLAGANATGAQSTFGVGVTLVGSTQYAFESVVLLSKSAGTTSHTIGMGFGGTATINNVIYYLSSQDQTAAGVVGTAGSTTTGVFLSVISTASNTTFTQAIATAARFVSYTLKGTVSINAGGTFIPQYTLSAAPGGAYSTVAGSYFAIYPLAASGSNVNIGSWA